MKWLDLTLATPAENLACDEALLDHCENEGAEILRVWESSQPFVVVGYGNHVAHEVNVEECRKQGVPIHRRCSGGGTVVQGPGCLNYNLTLRETTDGPLATVTGTNEFVMERHRQALAALLGVEVSIQGHTDLAFAAPNPSEKEADSQEQIWFKFSGNAQRRRRQALVFHGTILYGFDLALIPALLRFPSLPPGYRDGRSHLDFVRNIPATAESIRRALRQAWQASQGADLPPMEPIRALVRARYANDDWNFRR